MRIAFAFLILIGCSKASDATAGKQMPKLPPPPQAALPTEKIAVEIAGKQAPAIDASHLPPPDFQDAEHRAWRLSTLVGAHPSFAVTGESGVTVEFRDQSELVPALLLTRRGELVVSLLDAKDPFPPYHGQGRRLGRPGDPLPRVTAPRKISIGGGDTHPLEKR